MLIADMAIATSRNQRSWKQNRSIHRIQLLARFPSRSYHLFVGRTWERLLGSTGYLTCGICWMCGNCYPREFKCPDCGAVADLDDAACPECGRAIGQADRQEARERFKATKKEEARRIFHVPQKPVAPGRPTALQPEACHVGDHHGKGEQDGS